jgi:8-oxo-dGTP pyrophosphatase MutT (NUDIX family)
MIFNEQPENFVPEMEVVACVVEHNNKILLLHRQDHKREGNKWDHAAGKVDKSDLDIKKAMLRELREETGIVVNEEDLNFHKTFFVSHLGLNFFYHYFYLKFKNKPEVKIKEDEHKDFTWVTPEEALNMPLVMDEDYCLKHFYGIK